MYYTYVEPRTDKSYKFVNAPRGWFKDVVAVVHTHVPGRNLEWSMPSTKDEYTADLWNGICNLYGSNGCLVKYMPHTKRTHGVEYWDIMYQNLPKNPKTFGSN